MAVDDKMSGESAEMQSESETNALLDKAEKFSILSAGIAKVLSDLSMEIKKALDRYHTIQADIELKKKDLKMLHDIDVSATSLKQLIEDQRVQRENLESLINSRRTSWEEEKARLDRKEKEYRENTRIQRHREEEEHRRVQVSEQLKAQQRVDEDLRAAEQKCQRMQEAMEGEYQERERALRERELECNRLIQELERFLLKLDPRAKPQPPAFCSSNDKEHVDLSGCAHSLEAEPSHPLSFFFKDMPVMPAERESLRNPVISVTRDSTTLKFSSKKKSNPGSEVP